MKNKKLLIISVGVSLLYIITVILSNNYYTKYKSILECVHIIGPVYQSACVYQTGQEIIVFIYKLIKIFSFVLLFISFFVNLFFLFIKKASKLVKVISMISIIIYAVLIFRFIMMIFSN